MADAEKDTPGWFRETPEALAALEMERAAMLAVLAAENDAAPTVGASWSKLEDTAESDTPRRLFHSITDCGGCDGLGSHRRWCPYAVGETAAYFGQLSERADSLGDAIGPNDMGAANMAWQVAAILRKRAVDATVTSPGTGGGS